MKKILFLRNLSASWTEKDLKILRSSFHVQDVNLKSKIDYFRAIWHLLKADVLFLWFGSLAYLPVVVVAKVLGKKIVVVTAGFDVAKVGVGNYGAFYQVGFKQNLRKFLFSCVDEVYAISKSNYFECVYNVGLPPSKVKLIPLGFDFDKSVKIKPWSERKNQVLIISSMGSDGFYRKGIFRALQLAERMRDVDFIFMGTADPGVHQFISDNYSANVKQIGFVKFGSEKFNEVVQDSKIVLQLSYHEGFGASVLDAAVLGCVPVVSSEYALPEVVGEMGYCVGLDDYQRILEVIRTVLTSSFDSSLIAHYYVNRYHIDDRAIKLEKFLLRQTVN